MSPTLKQASIAGKKAIIQKENPTLLSQEDFFQPVEKSKISYGKLINADAQQIALLPSASYGFANAFNNLKSQNRLKAICVGEEFPSGYFSLVKWCKENDINIEIIKKPKIKKNRVSIWQQEILDAINQETAVVLISAVHWMDGSKYDLQSIGEKCANFDIPLFVDGTQAVGAQSIDVQACHITALINPSYKWLLGPYGLGFAYYAPYFNNGIPIEESWMNRDKASDFSNLTDYNEHYLPGAKRFDVGESASFINLAMMQVGIDFINDLGVEKIEGHCREITKPLLQYLRDNDFWFANEGYRAAHLFGFELPASVNLEQLKVALVQSNIYLSFRKNSVRVSPNIYNTNSDIHALIECLKKVKL